MIVISTGKGFVLKFFSKEDLSGVIEHLSVMSEWVEKEGVEPPYVYSVYDSRVNDVEVQIMLDNIKKGVV